MCRNQINTTAALRVADAQAKAMPMQRALQFSFKRIISVAEEWCDNRDCSCKHHCGGRRGD
jgi:hypothetical protein